MLCLAEGKEAILFMFVSCEAEWSSAYLARWPHDGAKNFFQGDKIDLSSPLLTISTSFIVCNS